MIGYSTVTIGKNALYGVEIVLTPDDIVSVTIIGIACPGGPGGPKKII